VKFHKPAEVRPLSIVNTDNRLMANAYRLRVEPLVAKAVSGMQRGFLPGRSMLQNVVEVDTEMRAASLSEKDPAAIFFDFAAAFPSLAHDFLHDTLEYLGLPPAFRLFVANLYFGNGCRISVGGELHGGFSIRAGIRQGCPLSPLLFALTADLLLRRLRRALPEVLLQAYADDLALVTGDLGKAAVEFVPLFADFAVISGLELNLQKTVFVPWGTRSTKQCECGSRRRSRDGVLQAFGVGLSIWVLCSARNGRIVVGKKRFGSIVAVLSCGRRWLWGCCLPPWLTTYTSPR
jgi:hypothetical protein